MVVTAEEWRWRSLWILEFWRLLLGLKGSFEWWLSCRACGSYFRLLVSVWGCDFVVWCACCVVACAVACVESWRGVSWLM